MCSTSLLSAHLPPANRTFSGADMAPGDELDPLDLQQPTQLFPTHWLAVRSGRARWIGRGRWESRPRHDLQAAPTACIDHRAEPPKCAQGESRRIGGGEGRGTTQSSHCVLRVTACELQTKSRAQSGADPGLKVYPQIEAFMPRPLRFWDSYNTASSSVMVIF